MKVYFEFLKWKRRQKTSVNELSKIRSFSCLGSAPFWCSLLYTGNSCYGICFLKITHTHIFTPLNIPFMLCLEHCWFYLMLSPTLYLPVYVYITYLCLAVPKHLKLMKWSPHECHQHLKKLPVEATFT